MMSTTIGHDAQRVVCVCAFRQFLARSRWHLSVALVAAALLALCSRPSNAAVIYGDMMGDNVTYLAITESSATDPGPLFGTPVVTGDSLDFTPTSFAATSQLHVPAADQTDGHLTFMVVPKFPGGSIQNIKFAEGGGLTVGGFGGNQTFVDVSAIGNIDVSEVDGVGINKLTIPIKLTFSHGSNAPFFDNGTWRLGTEGFVNDSWTGSQLIDIVGYLHANGYPNATGATKITVALDNKLYAQSEIEATAQIDKKDFFTVTTNVPEPTSCVLAIFGMMIGGLVARRTR